MTDKPASQIASTTTSKTFEQLAQEAGAVTFDANFCRVVNGIVVCDLVGAKIALTQAQFDAIKDVK